jgi:hypothetical protein
MRSNFPSPLFLRRYGEQRQARSSLSVKLSLPVAELWLFVLSENTAKLVSRLIGLADDSLSYKSAVANWDQLGILEVCAFLDQGAAVMFRRPDLSHALLYFLSSLCRLSNDLIFHLLEIDFLLVSSILL